jgi:hypothetical protein
VARFRRRTGGARQSLLARAGGTDGWQAKWNKWLAEIAGALPLANPDTQAKLVEDSIALWNAILEQYGSGFTTRKGERRSCRARTAALAIHAGANSRCSR